MSEHIHDWNVQIFQFAYGNPPAAECYVCHAELSEDEVNRRLNAVEKLEKLIADLQEDSKDGPNEMGGPFVALSVIARVLEK